MIRTEDLLVQKHTGYGKIANIFCLIQAATTSRAPRASVQSTARSHLQGRVDSTTRQLRPAHIETARRTRLPHQPTAVQRACSAGQHVARA